MEILLSLFAQKYRLFQQIAGLESNIARKDELYLTHVPASLLERRKKELQNNGEKTNQLLRRSPILLN